MRIPDKKKEIIWKTVEGEAVLLDPMRGQYFGLNSIGSSFWEKVDGVRTSDEIIDLLMQEYEVDREILNRDIDELMLDLKTNGLLIFLDQPV